MSRDGLTVVDPSSTQKLQHQKSMAPLLHKAFHSRVASTLVKSSAAFASACAFDSACLAVAAAPTASLMAAAAAAIAYIQFCVRSLGRKAFFIEAVSRSGQLGCVQTRALNSKSRQVMLEPRVHQCMSRCFRTPLLSRRRGSSN